MGNLSKLETQAVDETGDRKDDDPPQRRRAFQEAAREDPKETAPNDSTAQPAQAEPSSERRRSRRSAWDAENQGGSVYVGSSNDSKQAVDPPAAAPEEIPSDEVLNTLSAKELKRIL